MEINPSKTRPIHSGPYEAIAPGTYYVTSVMTGKVIAVADGSTKEGSQIVQETKNGNDSQKWIIEFSPLGYTLRNKQSGLYAGLTCSEEELQGNYFVQSYREPVHWSIVSSKSAGVDDAYQLIAKDHQDKVLDLRGGFPEDGAQILAYRNFFGKNDQKGENQAWTFQSA